MTFIELVNRLQNMLNGAAKGDRAMTIHLFGIQYGQQIKDCHASPVEIAIAAGISKSYGTEIQKGVRLSERVVLKSSI